MLIETAILLGSIAGFWFPPLTPSGERVPNAPDSQNKEESSPQRRQRSPEESNSENTSPSRIYHPPQQGGREQEIETQGTRGRSCRQEDSIGRPTLVAPEDHTAIASTRPPLILYLREQPLLPIVVSLSSVNERQLIFRSELSPDSLKPGFTLLDFPSSVSDLEVEQEYIWTVVVLCRPELALNPHLRVSFRTKNVPSSPSNLEEKVIWLGSRQIWYDAVGHAYTMSKSNRPELFWQLLIDSEIANKFRRYETGTNIKL